ncbi:hypothetical protein J5Y09_07800 [Roseomonas sp. PWR1]|uniref:Uncharacterized protein n=1 Tax=Roseomonas nitratireducens TaxID=2820810 RepID=A0ABS4AR12_9PROT|nr:hypothetical protein [Neoroseomonas nitratireducens]MBP0463810.1 hypothetical protein [Neoroseomonas nitratireducens]
MRRVLLASLLVAAALAAAAGGARAFEPEPGAIARIGGLEVLKPLDAQDLGRQRGGRLPAVTPGMQAPAPMLRLWDEIGRPTRPQDSGSQGVVTSTHRGAR